MKLTSLQYRSLKNNWKFHTEGWSAGMILGLMGWRWLVLAILGLVAGFVGWRVHPVVSGLAAGICFGAILRDIGTLRMNGRMWPITDEIIDWPRVEELLQLHERRDQNGG